MFPKTRQKILTQISNSDQYMRNFVLFSVILNYSMRNMFSVQFLFYKKNQCVSVFSQ